MAAHCGTTLGRYSCESDAGEEAHECTGYDEHVAHSHGALVFFVHEDDCNPNDDDAEDETRKMDAGADVGDSELVAHHLEKHAHKDIMRIYG